MRFVLLMLMTGTGVNTSVAIHTERFEHRSACERAATVFNSFRSGWVTGTVRGVAVCIEDAP